MAIKQIEQWFPDGLPNAGNFGPIRVYFDPEANSGNGQVTFTDDSSDTLDPQTNREAISGQYPSPPNPFYSSAGNKFTLSRSGSTPYATAATAAVVCDLANLEVDVQPATDTANGQISINVTGTNGTKEYSIDNGATWSFSPVFSNLSAGVYDVVVADAARFCTLTQEVDVPNEIVAVDDLKITNVAVTNQQVGQQFSGAITITATGTNTPFTYALTLPGGLKIQKLGSGIFTGLLPGVYTVEVTDAEGFVRRQSNVIILEAGSDEPTEALSPTRVTEIKTIEVRDLQCRSPFPIRWLNNLGGIDHWVFENKQVFEQDVEQGNEYASAYSDLESMKGNLAYNQIKSRQIVTIGANNLNQNQADAISKIMQSRKVELMKKDSAGNWYGAVELTPVAGSMQKYDTSINYQTVEIQLMYPESYL